jgi:hypothetical protein
VNVSFGSWTRRLIPFSSLESTVVVAWGSVDGTTPPPQAFARLSDSSFVDAFSEAGPRAASWWRSLRLAFAPFAVGLMRVACRVLR